MAGGVIIIIGVVIAFILVLYVLHLLTLCFTAFSLLTIFWNSVFPRKQIESQRENSTVCVCDFITLEVTGGESAGYTGTTLTRAGTFHKHTEEQDTFTAATDLTEKLIDVAKKQSRFLPF